jgi:hypothetical protein
MSCFATVSQVDMWYHGPACSAKVSRGDTWYYGPSCTMWACARYQANPYSSERETQPIVFLISKQAAPYQTRGGRDYPGVPTPNI